MIAPAAVALLVVGTVAAGISAIEIGRRYRDSRAGRLVAIDAGRPLTLRSDRYRLVGRPDVVRRLPDGRRVPIEIKRSAAPRGGPFRSHRIQIGAYCLLLEETDGRPPPFGILRYADGEFRVAWDAAARAEVLAVRRAVGRPYDGRATPTPGRCARCRWSDRCDVQARAGGPA